MSQANRQAELLLRTREAAEKWAAERSAAPASPLPQPGDLFVLEGRKGVREWAVLEVDPASGRALIVPADTHPFLGSADVASAPGAESGPLSLRCRQTVWLDLRRFATARRSGAVNADLVRSALDACRGFESGASLPLDETDLDPDYRALMNELASDGQFLQEAGPAAARARVEIAASAESPRAGQRRWAELLTWGTLRPILAPALAVVLGLALVREHGALRALREDRARAEQEHQQRLEAAAQQREQLESRLRQALAEAQRGAAAGGIRPEGPETGGAPALLNVPLVWLNAIAPGRGIATPMPKLVLSTSEAYAFLVIELNPSDPQAEYEMEITAVSASAPPRRLRGLRAIGEVLSIALSRSTLSPGTYYLKVWARRGGRADLQHEYVFEVVGPEAATSSRP